MIISELRINLLFFIFRIYLYLLYQSTIFNKIINKTKKLKLEYFYYHASLFFTSKKIMYNKRFSFCACVHIQTWQRETIVGRKSEKEKNWRTFGEIINLRESNHSSCRWLHESNISITNRCIYERPEKLLLVVQTKNVSLFRAAHSCRLQKIKMHFFQIKPIKLTYLYPENNLE